MGTSTPIRLAVPDVRRGAVSAAGNGNNELVPAQPHQRINVLGLLLVAAGDVDVKLTDGPGGANLTGAMSLAVDGNGVVLPMSLPGLPWLRGSVNTALTLNLSSATAVAGLLVYYVE